MEPYMEAALRQDGGDAETGIGIELGGGVRWSTSRLHAELGGRTLMLHKDEGLREWGLMGAIEYGSPGRLGPSMRVPALGECVRRRSMVRSSTAFHGHGKRGSTRRDGTGVRGIDPEKCWAIHRGNDSGSEWARLPGWIQSTHGSEVVIG